jgi:hypothetical protein
MRFNEALELEKHRAEQDRIQEDKDKIITPCRKTVTQIYNSARAWNDPIGASFHRIQNMKKTVPDEEKEPDIKGRKVVFSISASNSHGSLRSTEN